MKRQLILFCFVCFSLIASGQSSTPNSDFESWRSGTYYYPLNYQYTSNVGAYARDGVFNVTRVTDKQSGTYAIRLETTSTPIDTTFAYFVNLYPGSKSPTLWHGGVPYNQQPTGIAGWYKYNVATQDSGSIIVAFSRGGNNIRTYFLKIGGVQSTYASFNLPFTPPLLACGLANDNVKNIVVDSQGNIWVATNGGGVSVFDGAHWTTYTTANGLAGNTVNSVFIDGSGNKWFGTTAGVSKFNGTTWTSYTNANTTGGLANNDVRGMQTDASGNYWFATFGSGVSVFDGNSTWKTHTTTDGLISNNTRNIKKDASNNMWIGTDGGVSKFNGTNFINYTTANGLVNNDVHHIQIDSNGKLWFATYGGVSKFDGTNWTPFTNSGTSGGLASDEVNKIAIDSDNKKWFATQGGGISVFDGTNWNTYTTADGLVSNTVYHISIDSKGIKWIGTPNGISKYDDAKWVTYTVSGTTVPDSVEFGALSCKFGPGMQNPIGLPGSVFYMDNVSFTGPVSQPADLNGDFESWQTQTLNLPDGWNILNSNDNVSCISRTSDSYQGSYAVELTTFLGDNNGQPAAQSAAISTGWFPNNCSGSCVEHGGLPYTATKDKLVFWYKYVPSGSDNAIVNLVFKKSGVTFFNSSMNLSASASYQRMEFPFDLIQTPDSVIINIGSSNWSNTALSYVGSDLKIDSIYFKSQQIVSGIKPVGSEQNDNFLIYPNPSNGRIHIISKGANIESLDIYTVTGEKVYSMSNTGRQIITDQELPVLATGIYFIKINDGKVVRTNKIVIK